MRRLFELFQRAREILRTEGSMSLLRRGSDFVKPYFWGRGTLYLYEHSIRERNEADFLPKVKNVTVRIVSSNREADVLAAEGFEFRSRFVNARRMLNNGAIALCIFVGREIAHIAWLGMTKAAKNAFDGLPYEVDFSNKEACVGGTVTIPKYRGLGLMGYGIFKKFQFLREIGVVTVRHAVGVDNMASRKPYEKFDSKIYAKARYLKILWWRFWKETPLTQSDHID